MNPQTQHFADNLANEIDAWDLEAARREGQRIAVIDARSPVAFARGHIPKAVSFPQLAKLGFELKELIGGLDWRRRDGCALEVGPVKDPAAADCGCGG